MTVRVNAPPPAEAVEGLKLVTAGTGLFTVVPTVMLLLPGTESVEVVATVAVSLTVPAAVGLTTKLTVALAPLLIAPRLHVTVAVPLQAP